MFSIGTHLQYYFCLPKQEKSPAYSYISGLMDLKLLQFGREEMGWEQSSPEDVSAAGGQLWGRALAHYRLIFLFLEQKTGMFCGCCWTLPCREARRQRESNCRADPAFNLSSSPLIAQKSLEKSNENCTQQGRGKCSPAGQIPTSDLPRSIGDNITHIC